MQVADNMTQEDEKEGTGERFTKMYASGWLRIKNLTRNNPGATGLYLFFAEHIDYSCGAVVADQTFLACQLGCSVRTIQRWLNYLEEEKAIIRIPVAGRVCAYALDPEEVWKGVNTTRGYAAFTTKTLVNLDGEIKRRIQTMLSAVQES